ncbi:MAG TPA: hypothetical protein VF143_03420 [Candidatus Nanopelagicales bacterium]
MAQSDASEFPRTSGSDDVQGLAADWYPDPLGRWQLRWWSGSAWTLWVSDGESVHSAPLVDRRHLQRGDLAHLGFVDDVLLPELAAHGVLAPDLAAQIRVVLRELAGEAMEPSTLGPSVPRVTSPVPAVGSVRVDLVPPSGMRPAAGDATAAIRAAVVTPRPEPAAPGPLSRWWRATRESVQSDLALHGVAYLGVLLFFVGAFGLVAFAFGDVQPGLRPLAELVIAAVPFAAAAMLVRRGAVVVGRALEVTGGLLLPVMLTTSLLDGMGMPPDLAGTSLVLVTTVIGLVLAAAYAAWSRRHPASALRYLVAPMLWFAVAMASTGLGRAIPSGEAVAVPGSAQVAMTMAALVATVAWARRARTAALAAPTCVAAVPGLLVLALLAGLTWVAEPEPWPAAVVAAGLLGLAGLELLSAAEPPADRLHGGVLSVLEPAWWALATLALMDPLGATWAGAIGAVGYLGMLELAGRRGAPARDLGIAAVAAGTLVLTAVADPWVAFGLLAAASGWAHLRRLAPFSVRGADRALDAAAMALPVAALAALSAAQAPAAAVLAGSALLLPVTVGASRAGQGFWVRAWRAWLVLLTAAGLVGSLQAWVGAVTVQPSWAHTASGLLLTVAAALGPLRPAWRPWAVAGLASWSWLAACESGDVPAAVRGGVLAVGALALVVCAQLPRWRERAAAAQTALVGHVVGLAAVLLAGADWGLAAALALATAGWMVTALADARGTSPAGAALVRLVPQADHLPPVLAGVGLPATVLAALHAVDPTTLGARGPLAVCVVAVGMAAAVRLGLPGRMATTWPWLAFGLTILATMAVDTASTAIGVLLALIAVVALVPARYRWRGMTWTAWAAVAPLAGLLAARAVPAFAAQAVAVQAALALAATGSVLLLASAAIDLRDAGWVPRWRPRAGWLGPPAVLGAAELAIGLPLLPAVASPTLAGWSLLAAAAALLVVGLLTRMGVLAGLAVVVAWAGMLVLTAADPIQSPVPALVLTLLLLGLAELGHRVAPQRAWWCRWDAPLLLAAIPVAASALAVAQGTVDEPRTDLVVGLLALGTAARLRRLRWVAATLAGTGTMLVLIGAHGAGPWWFAAALALLAIALTAGAARSTGGLRLLLQVGAAGTATLAWLATLDAAGWSTRAAVDRTALLCGAVALAAGMLARVRPAARSWALLWGTTSMLGALATSGMAWAAGVGATGWLAAALALVATAALLAAAPLAMPVLRDVGALFGLGAVVVALLALGAGPTAQVAVLVALGLAAAAVTLLLTPPWWRQVAEVGVGATAVALLPALAPAAPAGLLVAVLVACAAQAAALGTVRHSLAIQVLAPVFACAAWLVFAASSIEGRPEAWSTPMGLALLVVVGLWRRDRMRRGTSVRSPEIVVVEVVGVALLVGASLVLMVTESLAHVVPALLLGIAVTVWGGVTQVRRRVLMGAVAVLGALLLLVAVPLVQLLPQWQGAGLWVLLLGLGILAMTVAAVLERGRTVARAAVGRFADLTQGWE